MSNLKLEPKWERWEPGVHVYGRHAPGSPDPYGVSVCLGSDGRWCAYVTTIKSPGDSQHRTLREAKIAAEKGYLKKIA
jgi:hypothetical protein